MNGNPIPINYSSFITQVQAVGGSDIAVNITRSASRLKTVFLSFNGAYPTSQMQTRTDTEELYVRIGIRFSIP
jgi:hypothetical protein